MKDQCRACRGSGHNYSDGSRCLACNGTGQVGTDDFPQSSSNIKKCPVCGTSLEVTCIACGYTVSKAERVIRLKSVIQAIEKLQRSAGASCDGMDLSDFRNTLADLTGERNKHTYPLQNETLTE